MYSPLPKQPPTPLPDSNPFSTCWTQPGAIRFIFPPGVTAQDLVNTLRATGWLSRPDLASRPGDAGPPLVTPGAQCLGPLEVRLSLAITPVDQAPNTARDAELGLEAVAAGDVPLCPAGEPLLEIEPRSVVLSAWKPAESGEGTVLRLLNPTDETINASVRPARGAQEARPVRLDESHEDQPIERSANTLELTLPPHALRSIWLP